MSSALGINAHHHGTKPSRRWRDPCRGIAHRKNENARYLLTLLSRISGALFHSDHIYQASKRKATPPNLHKELPKSILRWK